MRCLPNPHWHAELRQLTGRDDQVARFLEQHPQVLEMLEDIRRFLQRWIPSFETEGRNYLTVAVGCTGGRHRSVYFIESLTERFHEAGARVLTRHRELS